VIDVAPPAPARTAPQVIADLAALGSAEAIAAHLTDRGVRGRIGTLSDCPIGRLVRAEAGATDVLVGSQHVFGPGSRTEETPAPIREFIAQFDAGRWPGLVEPVPGGGA